MYKYRTSLALLILQTATKIKAQQCPDQTTPALWLDPNTPAPAYTLESECPEGQTTGTGCCLPEGSVNWDGMCGPPRRERRCRNDQYFNSAEYLELTHTDKMAQLWNQLTVESPTIVKCQNFGDMAKHFNSLPGRSYLEFGDEMPTQGRNETRQKLVHQQGVVGQARYEVTAGLESHGYTGIFATGADDVLIRFSEVGLHVDGITTSVNPSLAFKVLRSGLQVDAETIRGTPSGNQFGMVGFETQGADTWNWWEKDLLIHLPQFKASDENMCDDGSRSVMDKSEVHPEECGPMTGGRWLSQATRFPATNGNVRLAQFDQDGNEFSQPHFPFSLRFQANTADLTATDGNSRFYDQLIEDGSAEIVPNTVLYEVFAKDGALPTDPEFKIGEIISNSYFHQSLWGDERLFFQHGAVNIDLDALEVTHPGFRQDNRINQNLPQFNEAKYGAWHDPTTFNVPETTEADVIKGMNDHGCPFAFVVDYINTLGPLN